MRPHCSDTWGIDLRPDYQELGALRKYGVPIVALTGTAAAITIEQIKSPLKLLNPEIIKLPFVRENLIFEVFPKKPGFSAALKQVVELSQGRYITVILAIESECEKRLANNFKVKLPPRLKTTFHCTIPFDFETMACKSRIFKTTLALCLAGFPFQIWYILSKKSLVDLATSRVHGPHAILHGKPFGDILTSLILPINSFSVVKYKYFMTTKRTSPLTTSKTGTT
ncbi:Bloom syndrome, partial [Paramuricea clavata]